MIAKARMSLIGHSWAAITTIYPEPRPNAGHSSASALATSARDGVPGVQRVGADASRGAAAALGDGPEVAAALLEDHPEEDHPEAAAWALVAHERQRAELWLQAPPSFFVDASCHPPKTIRTAHIR